MTMGSGTAGRPTRNHLRRALPVAFLVLSLGVAGFGALEAWRAQRSHRATATGVLADYGEFAAWSYAQRLGELMGTALNASFAVVHQNRGFATGTATEQCLDLLLETPGGAECRCGERLAGGYAFHTRLGEPAGGARWAGEAPDAAGRLRVMAAVRRHAVERYQDGWPFAVLHVEDGPVLAYTRLVARGLDGRSEPGADTLLYGVELDRERLVELMRRALGGEILLPPTLTRGRPNHEVIKVEVVEPSGSPLFVSNPGGAHSWPAKEDLRPLLGGGTIRASVLPSVADQLVIGGLPEDHTPVLLLIFALAGALAVAAVVQLRRENRLALLRQDFVASVSHELRTPLAQVRLFTETLRLGRARDEEQKDWALENIDRETLRLTHLVENILHFSRAERGLHPVEREPTDLAAEAKDALAAFRPLVPRHRARLECRVPDGLLAEVHRDSFRQVLLNYLDNAVRYGPSGQTVRLLGERDGPWVRVAVTDEGPGVPPPERESIFEPFRRGDAAVGTVVSGSGIGLSVVREIARAHGGRERVEDAPGGGARFVLELPALRTARSRHFGAGDGRVDSSPDTAGTPARDRATTSGLDPAGGGAGQEVA